MFRSVNTYFIEKNHVDEVYSNVVYVFKNYDLINLARVGKITNVILTVKPRWWNI